MPLPGATGTVISAANRKNAPEKGLDSAGFTDINSANIFKSSARRWSFFYGYATTAGLPDCLDCLILLLGSCN